VSEFQHHIHAYKQHTLGPCLFFTNEECIHVIIRTLNECVHSGKELNASIKQTTIICMYGVSNYSIVYLIHYVHLHVHCQYYNVLFINHLVYSILPPISPMSDAILSGDSLLSLALLLLYQVSSYLCL
jgi:hypothetical protein